MKSSILTFFLIHLLSPTACMSGIRIDGAADGDEIVLTYPGQYWKCHSEWKGKTINISTITIHRQDVQSELELHVGIGQGFL